MRYDFDRASQSLSRSDLGMTWSQSDRLTIGQSDRLPRLPDARTRQLCGGVLGFDCMFFHADGNTSRDPSTVASPVRAVRIAVVLLDTEAARLLTTMGLQTRFTDLFANHNATPPASTRQAWDALLDQADTWAGVPEPVRRRLKTYERFILLPST